MVLRVIMQKQLLKINTNLFPYLKCPPIKGNLEKISRKIPTNSWEVPMFGGFTGSLCCMFHSHHCCNSINLREVHPIRKLLYHHMRHGEKYE